MKIKLSAFIFLFAFLAAGSAFAMPSDADSNTYQLKGLFGDVIPGVAIGFGGSGDFILDRNLEDASDLEATFYGGNIYVDPHEQVHLNLFLGAGDIKLGNVPIDNGNTETKAELETETDFAIGASGKVDVFSFPLFPDEPNSWIFVSGGYRYTHPDVDEVTRGGFVAADPTFTMNIEYSEWMATIGWSQAFTKWIEGVTFMPYVGAQYSDVRVDRNGVGKFLTQAQPNGQNQSVLTDDPNGDDVVNVICGIQILGFDNQLSVAVEGRFVAETAVSVSGHLRW